MKIACTASPSHIQNVNIVCRIYGLQHTSRLNNVFSSNFELDMENIHPPRFCNVCYATLLKTEKRSSVHSKMPKTWLPHTEGCSTCEQREKKSKGGRPTKNKGTGRPKLKSCLNTPKGSIWPPGLLSAAFLRSPMESIPVSLRDLKILAKDTQIWKITYAHFATIF